MQKTDKEILEALLKIIHDINMENASKKKPVSTLAEVLSEKSVTSLRELGKLCGLSGLSKMSKQFLIPKVISGLTDENFLKEVFFFMDSVEWEFFTKVVKVTKVTDDKQLSENYSILLKLCILCLYYHDGHFHYVVPNEIKIVYKSLEKSGFTAYKKHTDLINEYALATTNLYGLISQDDFVELFNSQNEDVTDIDEVFETLYTHILLKPGYCFYGVYIVNDYFEGNDFLDVGHIARLADSKPRYSPDKQELLKYSDWCFNEETPELNRLRMYISNSLTDDEDLQEDILENICFMVRAEAESQDYIDLLEDNGIYLEFKQLQTIMDLIINLHNTSRLWSNNGNKPNDLIKAEDSHLHTAKNESTQRVKVSRNAPCPCGSEKKYKRCCGR